MRHKNPGLVDWVLGRPNELINATRRPDLLTIVADMLAFLTIAAVKAIWVLELSE